YKAMVKTEGCRLEFERDAIREIAEMAFRSNQKMENIGARRLHTILTTLLEDILYQLPDSGKKEVTITAEDVRDKLEKVIEDDDIARYVL
ncbi:MAG: HslU--HslV peptidase ATPase subunit, partial [Candidatus Latescibacteria bacterium]|nr:HslU--HslV peptidase ATPase subunit [bacterium]MBD3423024.1 HslU--HslV peptidase ATPase subunit [Candidatus Latescibacterota bacterium]